MGVYLKVVHDLANQFNKFELRIPRGENTSVDALAALASTSDPTVRIVISVEGIERPSINNAVKTLSVAVAIRSASRSIPDISEEQQTHEWHCREVGRCGVM